MESASLLAEVWWNIGMEDIYKVYPNNPPHYFLANAMYMVTGSTLYKQPFLRHDSFKEFFLLTLFQRTSLLGWALQAWAVLNNHYHFIAKAPENPSSLATLIRQLHSITAIEFNRRDNSPGRQVWYNYWDTCLTYEKAYLARLHYVHLNPIKHGLAQDALRYPYCSYRWFMEQGDAELKVLVFEQPIGRVRVMDDF